MPKAQTPKPRMLKVRLTAENTGHIEAEAERGNTTPPRIVNKIVSGHYQPRRK